MAFACLVVLGCRVGTGGWLSAPAERRVQRAAAAYAEGIAARILCCGGKSWQGMREADAFAAALAHLGVPASAIDRELHSRSTLQNARYAAKILSAEQRRVALVTCDYHMPRALRCFRAAGFEPTPICAPGPVLPPLARRTRAVREWLSHLVDRLYVGDLARQAHDCPRKR